MCVIHHTFVRDCTGFNVAAALLQGLIQLRPWGRDKDNIFLSLLNRNRKCRWNWSIWSHKKAFCCSQGPQSSSNESIFFSLDYLSNTSSKYSAGSFSNLQRLEAREWRRVVRGPDHLHIFRELTYVQPHEEVSAPLLDFHRSQNFKHRTFLCVTQEMSACHCRNRSTERGNDLQWAHGASANQSFADASYIFTGYW